MNHTETNEYDEHSFDKSFEKDNPVNSTELLKLLRLLELMTEWYNSIIQQSFIDDDPYVESKI